MDLLYIDPMTESTSIINRTTGFLTRRIKKYNSVTNIRYEFQRSVQSPEKREQYIQKQINRVGQANFNTSKSFLDPSSLQGHAEALKTEGMTSFGKVLDDEQVEKLKEQLSKFSFYDKPGETNTARYKQKDLLTVDALRDIATDPGILEIAQQFLGGKPAVSGIASWWSYANCEEAQNAQLYHRDYDNWKFCKIFLYLTDVDEGSGPTTYVKNTSNLPTFRDIRRIMDHEVAETFPAEDVVKLTCPKGTVFMADTYGIHKGQLPEKNDRLIFFVLYAMEPMGPEPNSLYKDFIAQNRLIK